MIRKLILEGWNNYRREVMSKECGDVQMEETRRAFYAGSLHLFFALQEVLDTDREPTDGDLAQMRAIQDEIEDYAIDLMRRTQE